MFALRANIDGPCSSAVSSYTQVSKDSLKFWNDTLYTFSKFIVIFNLTNVVYFVVFSSRYFCVQSSNSSQMEICPIGNFCPEGSGNPTPCPTGTYSNTQGLQEEANCTLCDPGQFCNDTGKFTTSS